MVTKYIELCKYEKIADVDSAENKLMEIINTKKQLQYKYVIVDECQDLRAPALRMLRALAGEPHENDMYLSGDSRQRIYNSRTSLSQCGIVINNRSRHLTLNYRSTAEIYEFAIKLQEMYRYDDMNGKSIDSIKSNCVFHGSKPIIHEFKSEQHEVEEIIRDIRNKLAHDIPDHDICIMLHTKALVTKYASLLKNNGLHILMCTTDQEDDLTQPGIRVMTMHRSKGLEYAYVYLPHLDSVTIPFRRGLDKAIAEGTEQEFRVKECNTLSVAITRAKRFVWLSYFGKPSSLLIVWDKNTKIEELL